MIGSASDRTVMRSAQETQRAAQAWGWSASRSRSDGHESVGFTRQSLLSPRASSPRSSPWPIALRNPFGSPKKRAMATSTASGHGNTVIETTNSSSNGRYDWCQTIAPSIGGWPRSSSQVFAVQHGCFRVLALDRSGRRAVRGSRSIPECRLISLRLARCKVGLDMAKPPREMLLPRQPRSAQILTADSVQQQPIAAPGGSEINHGIHQNTRKRESESTSPFRVLAGGNPRP
jgi:hypothetical protein